MHTPGSPVSFAWAQAMNAAISSCRTTGRSSMNSPTVPTMRASPLVPGLQGPAGKASVRPPAPRVPGGTSPPGSSGSPPPIDPMTP